MKRPQETGKTSSSQEDGTQRKNIWMWGAVVVCLAIGLLLLGGVVLIFLAHSQVLMSWKMPPSYIGWGAIGFALLLFLFLPKYILPHRAAIWIGGFVFAVALLGIVVSLLVFPSLPSTPIFQSPNTFSLDASKIKSDLDDVANVHQSVEVILVVNSHQYGYQAQILQMTNAATPITCFFAPPTPCLNGGISTVSIALVDCSLLNSFSSELPNASTIYLLPISVPTPTSTLTVTPTPCS